MTPNKQNNFCSNTFHQKEICLILEAFKDVPKERIEDEASWPLTSITSQVFRAITSEDLDNKWGILCQDLMSQLYQMKAEDVKDLRLLILGWKQSNNEQKRHTLQRFAKPNPTPKEASAA